MIFKSFYCNPKKEDYDLKACNLYFHVIKMSDKLSKEIVIKSIVIAPYNRHDSRYKELSTVWVDTVVINDNYLTKADHVWKAEAGLHLGYPRGFDGDVLAMIKARKVIGFIEDKLIEKFRKYRTSFIKGFSTYPGLFDISGYCNIDGGYFRIGNSVAIHMEVDATTDKSAEGHTISYDIVDKMLQIYSFNRNDNAASLTNIMTDEFKQFVSGAFPQSSYTGFKGSTNLWKNISLEQLLE